MLDKIIYKSDKEATLIFTNRLPFTVSDSGGRVMELVNQLLTPNDSLEAVSLSDWFKRHAESMEDTQIIQIEEII